MSIILRGDGYSQTIRNQGMYSDGTPMVKVDDFEAMTQRSSTMIIRHADMIEFVTAMMLTDAINANGGYIRRLILPYVPGARQDRINPTGDVLFTIQSVARMINSRLFERVVILDPHSQYTVGLINNVLVYPQEFVARHFDAFRYDGIIAADKGGEERARQMRYALGLPMFYGGKTRDVSTGKLSGFTLEYIPSGHYLVVDDICDGGGTFTGLAEKIREQGSTADLFVSHGIFSKGASALLNHYNTIYTTDSLVGSDDGGRVTVIPVVEEMEHYYG
jgi:ribose-phosphate pyrophosphokinase